MKEVVIVDEYDIASGNNYSFLNFFSLGVLLKTKYECNNIKYMCDGLLMAIVAMLLLKRNVARKSFDYTSLAGDVFSEVADKGLGLFILGGTDSDVESFVCKVESKYDSINVVGYHSGYPSASGGWKELADTVVKSGADVLIVGLGAGLQEKVMLDVRSAGFKGTSFTCGGFISQLASNENEIYYPAIMNKLNLRFLYRMWKEPHTVRRYLINYPQTLWMIICGKVKLRLESSKAEAVNGK